MGIDTPDIYQVKKVCGSVKDLTLRDLFAAVALHGYMVGNLKPTGDLAEAAYNKADAMLKAREQGASRS